MIAHPERPILAFDSTAEMGRYAKEMLRGSESSHGEAWDGGVGLPRAIELCQTGDESVAPDAMKLVDQFEVAIETTGRQRVASVYGAYPVVPEFLTGVPECMRRVTDVEGESMPVRIVVGVTSSAGISSGALAKRGAAILALTMAISRVRPVSLEVIVALSGCRMAGGEDYTIVRAQINSQPLDISTAAFALSSAAFQRHVGYGLCKKLQDGTITRPDGERYGAVGSYSNWQKLRCPDGNMRSRPEDDGRGQYSLRMRELLDLGEEDVYIPEIYLYDKSVNDPLEWVKDCLRELHLLPE